MNFFKEMWAVFVAAVMAWISRIDNNMLNKIVNLLTILIILIGLTDWFIRKIKSNRATKKKQDKRQVLDLIENTQKPFKTVNMLDNPMETSEKIGNLVDKISKKIGGETMKKFFKWLWYNKEQLFSILYNIALMVLSQIAVWTDLVSAIMPVKSPTAVIIVKVIICALSIAFTALTVRNICVKYGLSSLDTIDKVLAERAEVAASKLTDEQKKTIKSYITTLQNTLSQAKTELTTAEKALAEITTLFNADNSLVADYSIRKAALDKKIAHSNAVISNVEAKIAEYKSQLDGKNKPKN